MSDTEHRIGTLFPITISDDIEMDTAIQQLKDTGYRKIHTTENVIYFIKDEAIDTNSVRF